jgi:hypothetical protein
MDHVLCDKEERKMTTVMRGKIDAIIILVIVVVLVAAARRYVAHSPVSMCLSDGWSVQGA